MAGCRRAPRGARGLKYRRGDERRQGQGSRPSRGAWVEIRLGGMTAPWARRRAPRGARGLKYLEVIKGAFGV